MAVRRCIRMLPALLLLWLAAGTSPASAFWQRSQYWRCSDAPTEAERIARECWIFERVPQWPIPRFEPGDFSGGYRAPSPYAPQGRMPTRRLG